MSTTRDFVQRLDALKEGERSRLRGLAGRPLDQTLSGFDLFTGVWWPLRQRTQAAPRREIAWLVAKLFGAFRIPQAPPGSAPQPTLARMLGRYEPQNDYGSKRFRRRFDGLLQSPLSALEPHLRWGLMVVAEALARQSNGWLDWVQLTDDLSIWDRGEEHRRRRDIRDIWAEEYLNIVHLSPRR